MRQHRWLIGMFTIVLIGCSNVQASNITPSVIPFPTATPEPSVKPLVMLPTIDLATATTAVPSADQLPLAACQQAVRAEATQYNIVEFSPDLMRVTPINTNTWEFVSTATVSFDNPNSATFELLWSCQVTLDVNQQWLINKVYYTSEW